jgi:hypothetical protein
MHRGIDSQLKSQQDLRQGRGAMVPVHGNRFVARQVFQHLDLCDADNPTANLISILGAIPELTAHAVDLTVTATNQLYPDSYIASTFKNLSKCRQIEEYVKENWQEG